MTGFHRKTAFNILTSLSESFMVPFSQTVRKIVLFVQMYISDLRQSCHDLAIHLCMFMNCCEVGYECLFNCLTLNQLCWIPVVREAIHKKKSCFCGYFPYPLSPEKHSLFGHFCNSGQWVSFPSSSISHVAFFTCKRSVPAALPKIATPHYCPASSHTI